jgi:hypothetical protein
VSDDHTPDGRASVTLVYKLLGELDDKMDTRFTELRLAIDSLRDSFVSCGVCHERHQATESQIAAAIKASEADREKLWDAMHDSRTTEDNLRTRVYQGVGAAAVLAIVLPIIVTVIIAIVK